MAFPWTIYVIWPLFNDLCYMTLVRTIYDGPYSDNLCYIALTRPFMLYGLSLDNLCYMALIQRSMLYGSCSDDLWWPLFGQSMLYSPYSDDVCYIALVRRIYFIWPLLGRSIYMALTRTINVIKPLLGRSILYGSCSDEQCYIALIRTINVIWPLLGRLVSTNRFTLFLFVLLLSCRSSRITIFVLVCHHLSSSPAVLNSTLLWRWIAFIS